MTILFLVAVLKPALSRLRKWFFKADLFLWFWYLCRSAPAEISVNSGPFDFIDALLVLLCVKHRGRFWNICLRSFAANIGFSSANISSNDNTFICSCFWKWTTRSLSLILLPLTAYRCLSESFTWPVSVYMQAIWVCTSPGSDGILNDRATGRIRFLPNGPPWMRALKMRM